MSKATQLHLPATHGGAPCAPVPARTLRETGLARVDELFDAAFGWMAAGQGVDDFNRKV
jgi:hypothetical protein